MNPEWFWRDVIGWQLNPEQRSRLGRTTGVYTLEDFQTRCPCPANQALRVLQITNFCVMVCSLNYRINNFIAYLMVISLLNV